jgi:DNA-binding MarR family transcriptional regulator
MPQDSERDLTDFLPYLLNMAAEESSARFQATYKEHYGILRTEWRVLFHLGRYGDMTAREICDRARIHKTKISRAVAKLETRRFLRRTEVPTDRRNAMLELTNAGQAAYVDLAEKAHAYNLTLSEGLSPEDQKTLRRCLVKLANLPVPPKSA